MYVRFNKKDDAEKTAQQKANDLRIELLKKSVRNIMRK